MHNLFHYENPFIQFLVRVGDLMILNLLFLVCALPVVTLGASLCRSCILRRAGNRPGAGHQL